MFLTFQLVENQITLDVSMSSDGTYDISLGNITDESGNIMTSPTEISIVRDTVGPDVTLYKLANLDDTNVKNQEVILIVFSEEFDKDDFTWQNINTNNCSVVASNNAGDYLIWPSNTTAQFTIQPDISDGDFSAQVDTNQFTDYAGNQNSASNVKTYSIDLTSPKALRITSSDVTTAVNGNNVVTTNASSGAIDFQVDISDVMTSDFDGLFLEEDIVISSQTGGSGSISNFR